MVDLAALASLKAQLIADWDRRGQESVPGEQAEAWLQSLPSQPPPRGGLAVGHAVDPASGDVRIELRVNAARGPDHARAVRLQRQAQLQGIEAILRVFAGKPTVPLKKVQPDCQSPHFGGKRKPLHIGASVAHEKGSAGTLGAFVHLENGGIGILSCTHVLAWAYRARVRKRDPIQQPGAPETVAGPYRIGELTEHFAPFVPGSVENLDAAVALLNDDVEIQGNVLPDAPCIPKKFQGRPIGPPLAQDEVGTGMRVMKVGRTTGFTRGVVSAVDFENFRPNLGSLGSFTFGKVHEIAWLWGEGDFAARGDSGALVMAEEGLNPIGLHFCSVPLESGGWISYLVPWWRINDIFPIRFV